MDMTFTPLEIGYAIVSLGLVAKGALDILARYKTKPADRGCLYGDKAHDELKSKLVEMQNHLDILDKKLDKREEDYKDMHGMAQEILILVRRMDK